MPHLTKQLISELEAELRSEQQSIKTKLSANDHYGLNRSIRDNTSELSAVDNHPADIGTELFERGKDLALTDHDELHLTRVEDALERIADGTYGYCLTCEKPIDIQRLKAIPETAYCKEHSPQSNVSMHRPVEEQFLHPPFGRTSLDERADETEFDGKDAWQIVESYGTSNSPAMAEEDEIDDYNDMEIEASNELDGFVEPYESFVATDIYGQEVFFYRNGQYRKHMSATEYLDSEESLGDGPNTY
ncbi:TraR/DksA C4-type zinc finger protein [Paenibacillus lentus]|uniref:Molecular chaperone DnaK n=1 Tax=Paenibacillus lentus TaxID=1338368 RepID=A0A3Q8S504_9BACL|nr:TraR/DksA C4-type zinc finger protein [Paenibacillus lentus]AZK46904.1 molecular chaperone DnaK [Paenibacillus lentus]